MPSTTTKRRKTSSASLILARITGRKPAVHEAIETHKWNASVAEMVLAAREKAGLTQGQLAKRIGTTQSVISRLEDADYEGHSLTMLGRHRRSAGPSGRGALGGCLADSTACNEACMTSRRGHAVPTKVRVYPRTDVSCRGAGPHRCSW